MNRELVFTPPALADLEEIFWFIAADNPPRARSYIAEIEQACGNLCDMPHMGVKRPDLRPGIYIFPALWSKCHKGRPAQFPVLKPLKSGDNERLI